MKQFNIYYVVYDEEPFLSVQQLMYIVAAKDEAQVVSILEDYDPKVFLEHHGSEVKHQLLGEDFAIVKIDGAYSNREGILEYAKDIYSIFK